MSSSRVTSSFLIVFCEISITLVELTVQLNDRKKWGKIDFLFTGSFPQLRIEYFLFLTSGSQKSTTPFLNKQKNNLVYKKSLF